ncbi:MAG: DUF2089 family protein [Candidatus Izemoplasmatales bacterium]|nr:DUF2089 family protein [Candidatus Izemoplasmatales bacterium]
METHDIPRWIKDLENDDLNFIRQFLLSSGSLKEMANYYGVTYPTLRLRLDRLIDKVKISETTDDPFERKIKQMALDGDLSVSTLKDILRHYRAGKDS